ncbi:PLDc N-terminal domain-containing protein [Corynebacterium oculi]|uniref:Cardiolipin synthase N-terminal domain-containing protein n=1 Tax=Corynebacterium oculi TaxID=1544416 RepID=A0A0Q0YET9_9CORY|nr:PLDc N-terminal domain-containing protein [Corynebacterium oculi]KQB84917.1 hypothetical protein Cocul_00047 [Corynebacterium oculi]
MLLTILIPLLFIGLPLAAIIVLLRDKRPGQETAIWALVIISAPVFGAAIYLIWRLMEKRKAAPRY